jgi:hypothetical protein
VPARALEALAGVAHASEQLRHLVEHDECGRAGERVARVRVGVDVFRAELPHLRETLLHEQRRRQRQPAAERLADADDVRDLLARPQLAGPPEAGVDRVDDEQGARLVAPPAQRRQKRRRWHPRTRATLDRLDDHTSRLRRQRPRIGTEGTPLNRPREPSRKRRAETLEAGRRECEQPRAVVGAVERDDHRAPGSEQRRAERDLDGVLACDAELRRPRQPPPQPCGRLGIREIAERVRHRRGGDRLHHARVSVPERGDAEAAGEVEVLAPVLVPDAAAFRSSPDQAPLRRTPGTRRPSVSTAM